METKTVRSKVEADEGGDHIHVDDDIQRFLDEGKRRRETSVGSFFVTIQVYEEGQEGNRFQQLLV